MKDRYKNPYSGSSHYCSGYYPGKKLVNPSDFLAPNPFHYCYHHYTYYDPPHREDSYLESSPDFHEQNFSSTHKVVHIWFQHIRVKDMVILLLTLSHRIEG